MHFVASPGLDARHGCKVAPQERRARALTTRSATPESHAYLGSRFASGAAEREQQVYMDAVKAMCQQKADAQVDGA